MTQAVGHGGMGVVLCVADFWWESSATVMDVENN
jgi:hypothetical protein